MSTPEPSAPCPSDATDRPVFDAEVLGVMFNYDVGLISGLLQTFVASTTASLAGISQAVAVQDLTTVAELSHRMAGASRLTGAMSFGDMAASVESAAKRNDLAAVQATLTGLTELWNQVQQAMGPLMPQN